MLRPIPKKILYSGTITGLRISSVDGTAFLDACAALVPFADAESDIYIYDSVGALLKATLKAQGTGESLGSELVYNSTFEGDYTNGLADGWTKSPAAAIPSEETVDPYAGLSSQKITADNSLVYILSDNSGHPFSTSAGGLYTLSAAAKSPTGNSVYLQTENPTINWSGYWASGTSWATKTLYRTLTADNTTGKVYVSSTGITVAGEYVVDNFSLKQVTAPSTDGVTLQASKWDATENFVVKTSGFKYNEASYAVRVYKAR